MTYEEAAKFLKDLIAHPLKSNGDDKYPNYWRAKFNEVLHLLDEQAKKCKILRIFRKYPKNRLSLENLFKFAMYLKDRDIEITDELLKYYYIPFDVDEYKTIIEWLEGKGK